MRHRFGYKILNITSEHRKALIKNMLNNLFKYEQITTTLPKAKDLSPIVEKLISNNSPVKTLLYHLTSELLKMIF